MHSKRRWGVGEVESPEALAEKLKQRTWTLCTGFYVRGFENYLFLNDATHEDGALEIGVIKGGFGAPEHVQIESVTFSWMTEAEALKLIKDVLAGGYDAASYARRVWPRLDHQKEHLRCHLCA